MRRYLLALGAIVFGSVTAVVTFVGPADADTPKAQIASNQHLEILSCMSQSVPPNKPMITLGDTGTKYFLSETPTPKPHPPFFYTEAHCMNFWVADFKVTHETKTKAGNNLYPIFTVGGRTGLFDKYHALTNEQLCDDPTVTTCSTAVADRNCRRLIVKSTALWKKHGWSDFKVTNSGMNGFNLDQNGNCVGNPYLSWGYVPVTYNYNAPSSKPGKTQGQVDGFWEIPKAGEEDIYREVAEAYFVQYPISDGWNQKPNAKALYVLDPAQYKSDPNPITEQLPLQVGFGPP